jgi:L-asparagine transporter-like permease
MTKAAADASVPARINNTPRISKQSRVSHSTFLVLILTMLFRIALSQAQPQAVLFTIIRNAMHETLYSRLVILSKLKYLQKSHEENCSVFTFSLHRPLSHYLASLHPVFLIRVASGERRTASGERRTANGERRTANGERRTANGLAPDPRPPSLLVLN